MALSLVDRAMRGRTIVALMLILGCNRGGEPATSETQSSSSTEESSATTSAVASETTGSSSTEATSSSATDTETGEDTGTEDTGTEACPEGEMACPDGLCVSDHPFFANACCAHGGECVPGCEPQDAIEVPGECPEGLRYAWDGESCHAICACSGRDCDTLYDDPLACFMVHDETCGYYDFSDCFVIDQPMPVSIAGKAGGLDLSYSVGVYGEYCDESGIPGALMVFAPDELSLLNYAAAYYWMRPEWPVLALDPFTIELGVHQTGITRYGGGEAVESLATVTLDTFDHGDELGLRELVGQLEVIDIDAGWNLSGSFTIGYCGLVTSKI